MSHDFTTVQWNQNKKVYDLVLVGALIATIVVHFVFSNVFLPSGEVMSDEIRLLRALGDTGFILLNLILAIGPLARIDKRFLPLLYNRRHMGVTFFLLVLIHGIIALFWYHGFGVIDPLTSLFTVHTTSNQISEYPFQPLGFIALCVFFIMAATSHDFWNAVLGPRFWKSLHMMVYVAYALVILHIALGPLQSEASALPFWAPWASLVWLGLLHLTSSFANDDVSKVKANEDWIEVDGAQDILPNKAKILVVNGGERIAVFRTSDDQYGAISNVCQHQAGPLGEGCMVDGLVTCPWHGFQYRLEDGQSPPPFKEKVETYNLKESGGKLYLDPKPLPLGTERPLVKMNN